MPKYSLEFKIKVVQEYLKGDSGSLKVVANKHKIPKSTLENWVEWFNSNGIDGLNKKRSNNKYSSEFKLSVIQYRQINGCSFREAAEHFNLPNGSMIANWKRIYEEKGLSGLNNNKRGRPKEMSEKENTKDMHIPLNETEREELIRLREENRLLKMKELYEKKLQALLLEQELEARKKRR